VELPHGGPAWLVTGHPETKLVLSDPRFSRAQAALPACPRFTPRPLPAELLQSLDPPDHTRVRRVVAREFTAHRVERLRPATERLVDELLDDLTEGGPGTDMVGTFAMPLPVRVICDLLGVPYSDREMFATYSDAMLSTTAYTEQEVELATAELQRYLAKLIEQQRRAPGAGLLGSLAQAGGPDGELSEPELVMLGVVILVGGYETTACQLANMLYTLLTRPDHFAALRDDPELIPGAVSEMVRFIPLGAAGSYPRVATSEVTVGDVTIRAGDAVITHAGAANRDERVFTNPHMLDFERQDNPHLGFGHGPHLCLGSRLATMELQVALRAVVRRFPTLRLAVPADEVAWKAGIILRGPVTLPVSW